MKVPSNSQLKKIKEATSTAKNVINKLTFKDIACDEFTHHNFRRKDISVKDLNLLLLGKVVSNQQNGSSTILNLLRINREIPRKFSRSSLNRRTKQIDPDKYLSKLIEANSFQINEDYKDCVFDGSSLPLPNQKEIEDKFPKHFTGKTQTTIKPIAKLHYLMTCDDHTCVGALVKSHDFSERVAMVQLAIEAQAKGQKLHIIADRGLYGATTGFLLDKYGHQFSLRYCSVTFNKVNRGRFKNGSLEINFPLNSKTFKSYANLDSSLKKVNFKFRVVRKKGNSKRKPIYIMTNDFDSTSQEILNKYWNRQRVEDSFKYLKSYGGLEKIHSNTSLQTAELIIATMIFYISIMEKALFQIIKTPRPDEDGELTANRKMAWQLFYLVIKSGYSKKMILEFIEAIQSDLMVIRSGRSEPRYILRVTVRTR